MGAMSSPPKRQLLFSPSQFMMLKKTEYTKNPEYGNYQTHRHNPSGQYIDIYSLQFSSRSQLQNYYQCFLQRYREQYIVNTIEFNDLSKRQICSYLYRAQVYIEHIPIRLQSFTDIPFPDNLYLLKNVLNGFEILYRMVGYFQVQENHVCVNGFGEVKVWFNTDLSKNYPEDENQHIKSECDMVHKIICLINDNTNQSAKNQFLQYLQKKRKKYPKFKQCLQLLDQYAEEYKIQIPKYSQSIFELFKDTEQSQQKLQEKQNENNEQKRVGFERDRDGSAHSAHLEIGVNQIVAHPRQSQNQSIVINQIVVPRLDIQGSHRGSLGVGLLEGQQRESQRQGGRQDGVIERQSQGQMERQIQRHSQGLRQIQRASQRSGQDFLSEKSRRNTVKIQQNLYGAYSFGVEEKKKKQLKTQRIVRNTNQVQQRQRRNSEKKNAIHNYNRLQTKRSPGLSSARSLQIKNNLARSVAVPFIPHPAHGNVNPYLKMRKPVVNFTYLSPLMVNSSDFNQQKQATIKNSDPRSSQARLSTNPHINVNSELIKLVWPNQIPNVGNIAMNKKQPQFPKSNTTKTQQNIHPLTQIPKKQQSISQKPQLSPTFEQKQHQIKKSLPPPLHPLSPEVIPSNQQKASREPIPAQKQPQNAEINEPVKRCFYITETGTEEIDPEIAADLAQYL